MSLAFEPLGDSSIPPPPPPPSSFVPDYSDTSSSSDMSSSSLSSTSSKGNTQSNHFPSTASSAIPSSATITSTTTAAATTDFGPSQEGFEAGGFIFVILVVALMVAFLYFVRAILARRRYRRLLATKTIIPDLETGGCPPTYYQHVQDIQVIIDPAPYYPTTPSGTPSPAGAVAARLPRSSSISHPAPAHLASAISSPSSSTPSSSTTTTAVTANIPTNTLLARSSSLPRTSPSASSSSSSTAPPQPAAIRGDRYYIVTPRTHSRSRSAGVIARRIHYQAQPPQRPLSSSSLDSPTGTRRFSASRLNQVMTAAANNEPPPPSYEDLSPRATIVVL